MSRQLGSVQVQVLAALRREPSYCRAIMETIGARGTSAIGSALLAMEARDLIEAVKPAGLTRQRGRPPKRYRITAKGRAALAAALAELPLARVTVEALGLAEGGT